MVLDNNQQQSDIYCVYKFQQHTPLRPYVTLFRLMLSTSQQLPAPRCKPAICWSMQNSFVPLNKNKQDSNFQNHIKTKIKFRHIQAAR